MVGNDISGHEVIRHELYTVHNGGANNGANNGGKHSHVAETPDDSNDSDSKKDSDDGKDEDADTDSADADPDDEGDDNKCVGNIEDSDNGNGAGE